MGISKSPYANNGPRMAVLLNLMVFEFLYAIIMYVVGGRL